MFDDPEPPLPISATVLYLVITLLSDIGLIYPDFSFGRRPYRPQFDLETIYVGLVKETNNMLCYIPFLRAPASVNYPFADAMFQPLECGLGGLGGQSFEISGGEVFQKLTGGFGADLFQGLDRAKNN